MYNIAIHCKIEPTMFGYLAWMSRLEKQTRIKIRCSCHEILLYLEIYQVWAEWRENMTFLSRVNSYSENRSHLGRRRAGIPSNSLLWYVIVCVNVMVSLHFDWHALIIVLIAAKRVYASLAISLESTEFSICSFLG